MTRTIHEYVFGNELGIVFVRRNHIGLHTCKICLVGDSSDDVVSLKSVNLKVGIWKALSISLMMGIDNLMSSGVS